MTSQLALAGDSERAASDDDSSASDYVEDSSAYSSEEEGSKQELGTSIIAKLFFFACASGMLFGIDLGSIGGALDPMSADLGLDVGMSEIVVSGAKFGAIFGCLFGGAAIQAYGRKTTVQASVVPFIIGPGLLGSAGTFAQAALGRFIMGLGVGLASVAVPCYLSEVTPKTSRGAMVATYELAIAIGFMFASVCNYVIESMHTCWFGCWRWQAGFVPMLAALPLLLSTSFLPESPRWLLSRAGGDAKMLKNALIATKALGVEDAVGRLSSLEQSARRGGQDLDRPKEPWATSKNELVALWDMKHQAMGHPLLVTPERMAARPQEMAAASKEVSVLRILRGTLRDIGYMASGSKVHVPPGGSWGLYLAIIAAVLDQVCASTAILIYTQKLLLKAGVGSLQARDQLAIFVAAAKVFGVLVGLTVVNKMGRRPLLGLGGVGSAIFLVLVAIGAANLQVTLMLVGICGFIFIFVATWGNGYWVIVTEVTAAGGPQFAAAAQAAATATLFFAGFFTSVTFVSVIEGGGPWAILIYAGLAALMALYAFVLLPETQGCTLEECAERVRERSRSRSRNGKRSSKPEALD